MQNVANGVVVVCSKGIWDLDAVVPVLMQVRECTTGRRVQQMGVNIVLQDLRYLC
jgi:hypothetical protein